MTIFDLHRGMQTFYAKEGEGEGDPKPPKKEQKDDGDAEVKKQLAEERAARKKAEDDLKVLRDAEAKAKKDKEETELKAKGDYEGLKKRYDEETKLVAEERRRERLQNELLREGLRAGIQKDSYLRLVDTSKIEEKDGSFVGVNTLIEDFKKENPLLFGSQEGGTGSHATPPKTSESADDLKKRADEREKRRGGPQKLF
jgi:hypothetical protein